MMSLGLVGGIREISRFLLFHADRPSIERYRVSSSRLNAAIQRIQRLMGSSAFRTEGADGSAQTY